MNVWEHRDLQLLNDRLRNTQDENRRLRRVAQINLLHEPWSRGDYTYATNGHIILRVLRLADVPENEKCPDAEAMMARVTPAKEWMPVPAATMPPDVECDMCKGTGILTWRESYGPEAEDCEWCNHTGKVRARIGMDVGGANFDQGYLSMIQGWEIAPNGQEAAWIRCGDMIGLLMPMRAV